nr:MAG TPA: Major head protein [Bacteriophage sp.]
MAAEENLIKKADLARAREIEFVEMFGYSIKKLMEALGVTRKIPKTAGTVLKTYKATGTLESGEVAEGDIIPLSKYKVDPVSYKEIVLKKWRKATTAEAIVERGYDQAVEMTTDAMLRDAQKDVRKDFFEFLKTGTGVATGVGLQATLAQAWGQLQVKFEDDEIDAVYFVNPLDAADYLATAAISTQTAFGMSYVENFLGLGTVIFNSSVPKGKIYATAKQNIVLYYIPVNGADLDKAFDFTSDATGLIGIHEEPDYTRMTAMDVVTSGLTLFAEYIDGVVVGTISATSEASTAGTETKNTGA